MMERTFISLYDDHGDEYIVNVDKIVCVNVIGNKVWLGDKTLLSICDTSMEELMDCICGRLSAFVDTMEPRHLEGLCQSK